MKLIDQWALLGLEPTDDKRAVKLAYTERLKETDVDFDPAAFIRLREARDAALLWGATLPQWEEEGWFDEPDGEDGQLLSDDLLFDMASPPPDFEWDPLLFDSDARPSLPPASGGALDSHCAELDRLLFGDAPPDPERVADLGQAIVSAPELVDVDRATATEQWLAQLIIAAAPVSDPLLEPAIARFGWRKGRRDWRRDHDVERVLERVEALRFRAACEGSRSAKALGELLGPPRRRLEYYRLGLAGEVRCLLEVIDSRHPLLLKDLNPDSVSWWRSYLRGPHLPENFWSIVLMIPIALSLFVAVPLGQGIGDEKFALLSYPIFVLITFLGILLFVRVRAWLRNRLEFAWFDPARHRRIARLAWAALAVPAAAAFAPDLNVVTVASWSAASLILVAAAWAALANGGIRPMLMTAWLPVVAAACAIDVLLILRDAQAMKLLLPYATLCWLGFWLYEAVQLQLAPVRSRLIALLGALALVLLVAGAVGYGTFANAAPDWAVALVPVAIIAAHFATSASNVHVPGYPFRVAAMLFFFFAAPMLISEMVAQLLLALCLYALSYCTARLGAALVEATRTARV